MTLSLSEHFSEPENNSKHKYYSSPCCLEQTAYRHALKPVAQYLYILNVKLADSCGNPITFSTRANTFWCQYTCTHKHSLSHTHCPNTCLTHSYLYKAYISALVSLLYTIYNWLGATAMQGEGAKLALWKSMFANWAASRFSNYWLILLEWSPNLVLDLSMACGAWNVSFRVRGSVCLDANL
jgi:hypothetical protein